MNSDTYKAAIFRGAGNVDVVALPFPKCGDGEVIVRNSHEYSIDRIRDALTMGGNAREAQKVVINFETA